MCAVKNYGRFPVHGHDEALQAPPHCQRFVLRFLLPASPCLRVLNQMHMVVCNRRCPSNGVMSDSLSLSMMPLKAWEGAAGATPH